MSAYAQPGSPAEAERAQAAAAAVADAAAVQLSGLAEVNALKIKAQRKGQEKVDAEEADLYRVDGFDLADRQSQVTDWLWIPGNKGRGAIPMGEITLMAGRGGVGKSTVLAAFAAWITRGTMFGAYHGTPRNVVYIPNEDDPDRTLKPRMLAAGADPARVKIPRLWLPNGNLGHWTVPRDNDRIAAFAVEHDAVAIMFDPLSSNLGVSNRNSGDEVRAVMESLRSMAERLNIAIIGNAHFRKASSSNSSDGLMGSVELVNVCRSMLAVMADRDREDVIVLSHDKSNYSKLAGAYDYKIVSEWIDDNGLRVETSRIEFLGKSEKNVSDMMAEDMAGGLDSKSAVGEAAQFLTDYLAAQGGQAMRKEIINAARGEGINQRAIQRAAERLHLTSEASGKGASRLWGFAPPTPTGRSE